MRGLYHNPAKKDRGLPLSFSSCQRIDDAVHVLLAEGVVGLIQDGLLLLRGHGGIGVQSPGIPGQGHAEADGHLEIMHGIASSALVSADKDGLDKASSDKYRSGSRLQTLFG